MSVPPHAPSYYAASRAVAPDRPALAGEVAADVCVVGAGFTGLSAALHLAERGYRVVVLEAGRVGSGASGRNGGQALVGTSAGALETRQLLGDDWAHRVWHLTVEAVALQKELIRRHAIACDYRPGYLYAAWNRRHMPALRAEHALQQAWGYTDARLVEAEEAAALVRGPGYAGGILDRGSGHLHPLNLAVGLAAAAESRGCRIYEGSAATAIEASGGPCVRSAGGAVRCRHVVLAGSGYANGLAPGLDRLVLPVVTYILATEPLGAARARDLIPDDLCVSDSKRLLNYFRLTADHRLLFGAPADPGRHAPQRREASLRRRMLALFPGLADVATAYLWGGTVDLSRNRLPQVGRLAGEVYYAQGLSGHGVALSTLLGALFAEALAGTAERFDVFARIPHRPLPGGPGLAARLRALLLLWYRLRDWR